jgi:hypothetical protein
MTINVNLGDGNYAGRGNELLRIEKPVFRRP